MIPSPEDYRCLIRNEWADIHHSRMQEWSALGVVTGAHLGLVQISTAAIKANYFSAAWMPVVGAAMIGMLLCTVGILLTCRHRHLMKMKLGWIYQAEERTGLIKTAGNSAGIIPENAEMKVSYKWRNLALPRLLSTSGLIVCFYVIIFLIDLMVLIDA